MQKFDVVIGLERVRDARSEWNKARREFDAGADKVLAILLHHAIRNFMSATDVAKALGVPRPRVVALMKKYGMHPQDSKRLLSEHAAKALVENAELMGIDPHEMDLMSPLAYLPMGKALREEFIAGPSKVTEMPEEEPVVAYSLVSIIEQAIFETETALEAATLAADRIMAEQG